MESAGAVAACVARSDEVSRGGGATAVQCGAARGEASEGSPPRESLAG